MSSIVRTKMRTTAVEFPGSLTARAWMRANSMAWGMQQHPGQLSLQETQGQQTIFNAIIPQHRGFRADFSDEKQIYSTVRSFVNVQDL